MKYNTNKKEFHRHVQIYVGQPPIQSQNFYRLSGSISDAITLLVAHSINVISYRLM